MQAKSVQLDAIKADFETTKKCGLQLARHCFMSTTVCIALQKGSRYTDAINMGYKLYESCIYLIVTNNLNHQKAVGTAANRDNRSLGIVVSQYATSMYGRHQQSDQSQEYWCGNKTLISIAQEFDRGFYSPPDWIQSFNFRFHLRANHFDVSFKPITSSNFCAHVRKLIETVGTITIQWIQCCKQK